MSVNTLDEDDKKAGGGKISCAVESNSSLVAIVGRIRIAEAGGLLEMFALSPRLVVAGEGL